jgi:hypothetical protein
MCSWEATEVWGNGHLVNSWWFKRWVMMGFYQHTQDSKNNQWGFNHEIEFQKTIEFGD